MENQDCFLETIKELENAQAFLPKISDLFRSNQVKAVEGVESYFNAPGTGASPLFHLVFGESMEMEKMKEAVCSSFFAFRMKYRVMIVQLVIYFTAF